MKKENKIIAWFKSESPIIQVTILNSIVLLMYAALATKAPAVPLNKNHTAEVNSDECDWSLEKDNFHTEGNFHNGTLWQISSRNGKYVKIIFGDGIDKRENLKDYQEAIDLSEYYISKGYGCSNYTL